MSSLRGQPDRLYNGKFVLLVTYRHSAAGVLLVTANPGDEMVPLQRVELITQDMDLIAGLIRELYAGHEAVFSCPDPALVDGRVRSVTAGGISAYCPATRCVPEDPSTGRITRWLRRRMLCTTAGRPRR